MQPQLPKREVKEVFHDDKARSKILAGVKRLYNVVSKTYGPAGYNVILGIPFGDPTLTRDGVTVAKRVIPPNGGFADRAESDAAAILRQASERTNKTAGDGTTATVVLSYHLIKNGMRLIAAGDSGMLLKKQLADDGKKLVEFLKENSLPGEDKLLEVATVSSGDPNIGSLISDTIKNIGDDGGISIREQDYPTLEIEEVNGYLFDKGFFALNQQIEYANPLIFVTQKQMASNSDIVPLLDIVIRGDNKNLVIVGDVRTNSDALNTLLINVMQGKLNAVVVPPPMFGDEAKLFMEDIATYVGSTLFTPADNPKNIQSTHFGSAERVQVNQDRAIIFNGGAAPEDLEVRIKALKDNIAAETSANKKDGLEQRFAKLTGKIAIVNVGGATQTEMEELRYRVEDAIEATKSALADGVLPGGATMYVRALDLEISPLFKQALKATFAKLMSNAGESADYRLAQIKRAPEGHGFNLRKMTDEPVDLAKEGVWDATRAIVQTVENAVSAAGSLLTGGAIVEPVDQEDKS